MHEFQNYSTKLYFAGNANNKTLAYWYSCKLGKAVKSVKAGKIKPYKYNGWDATELVEMLEVPIANLNEIIKAEQWSKFDEQFDLLINTCNSCHIATEHPFVIIKTPSGEPPNNQVFNNH